MTPRYAGRNYGFLLCWNTGWRKMMLKDKRKKILVLADWYEPGFKAGGPIRSCVNFVQYMKDGYELFLLTTDRDMGDSRPYEGIETDTWLDKDGVSVFYASPQTLGWK